TPAASNSPMTATTRGRYSIISGTRISSTPFAIPSFRQRASGASGRTDGMLLCPRKPTCADDTIWLTDDGDHTVRQCTLEGKVLLTLGISGKPAPFMSGEPFHRCTHTAMSPQGDIYVSDGYGNSRVHKYAPNGKLLLSWGGPGTDPGEFNIAHNIACDADG